MRIINRIQNWTFEESPLSRLYRTFWNIASLIATHLLPPRVGFASDVSQLLVRCSFRSVVDKFIAGVSTVSIFTIYLLYICDKTNHHVFLIKIRINILQLIERRVDICRWRSISFSFCSALCRLFYLDETELFALGMCIRVKKRYICDSTLVLT